MCIVCSQLNRNGVGYNSTICKSRWEESSCELRVASCEIIKSNVLDEMLS